MRHIPSWMRNTGKLLLIAAGYVCGVALLTYAHLMDPWLEYTTAPLMKAAAVVVIACFMVWLPYIAFRTKRSWFLVALLVPGGGHLFAWLNWGVAKRAYKIGMVSLAVTVGLMISRSFLCSCGAQHTNFPHCDDLPVLSPEAIAAKQARKAARAQEISEYMERVKEHVRPHWRGKDQFPGLTAQAQFGLDEDGSLSCGNVVTSSGNAKFDPLIIQALNLAGPLPTPPAEIREFCERIVIRFDGGESKG